MPSHHPQIAELAKARAVAVTELTALLTGGIYTRKELERHGLNPTYVSAAYNTQGKLKPTCIISYVSPVALGLRDPEGQYSTYRTILEFWFYQHGDNGHEVLESVANLVYDNFNELPMDGCFETIHIHDPITDQYAKELQDAAMFKSEYSVRYERYRS